MQLLEIFQDIANHIRIEPCNFFVSHHNYQVPKLEAELIERLQKLPQEMQDKYLTSLLQNLIYSIYFDGLLVQKQLIKIGYKTGLENALFEIDWEFYERLHKNNEGKGSFHPNFRVLRQEVDGSLAVQLFGVTLHIQRERHLQLKDQSATVGNLVAVSMPSSQLKPGYYTAIGDVVSSSDGLPVLIYFNFSPEGAVAFMKGLTTQLNVLKVFFTFLASYNPSYYGGYYSAFMRFNKHDYELIWRVLNEIYIENKSFFQKQVPTFTKTLAPGVGLAEEPEYEFEFLKDFGMNRCTIITNALMKAHNNGDESKKSRMRYILEHFEQLGIDIEHPYLNPNSEDIYTPLDQANDVTW